MILLYQRLFIAETPSYLAVFLHADQQSGKGKGKS
jgi:hypothetical protein